MNLIQFDLHLLLLTLAQLKGTWGQGFVVGGGNRFRNSGGWGGHRGGGGGHRVASKPSHNRFPQRHQTIVVLPQRNDNSNNFEYNKYDSVNNNNHNNNENSNFGQNNPAEDTQNSQCVIPSMGDLSKFELRCILVDSDKDEDCSILGPLLSSGSVVMLKCRSPYVSETGETRLWTCDNGLWKGEFKAIRCIENQVKEVAPKPNPPWFNNLNNRNPGNSNAWNELFPGVIDSINVAPTPNNDLKTPSWEKPVPVTTENPNIWRPYEEDNANTGWHWQSTTTTTSTTTSPTTTSTTTTPTTTTTTTTPTTTTTKPALNIPTPGPDILDGVKCPSLSKRPGFQLKCVSKISLPWAPSSFVVTEGECDTSQPVGSEASYQCEKYYMTSGSLKTLYRKCKEDGTWSGSADLFACSLECGVPNPAGQIPLITHGEPTYKAQWPWHAALFYREKGEEAHLYNCGGTLINKRIVLSAGHCVVETGTSIVKNVTGFRIDLGRYERNVDDEYVQTFSVEEIIVHPDYNPFSYDSDIAIIVLKSSVSIGYHVRPACYPQSQNAALEEAQLASGSVGTVVGFGRNENNVEATVLHMAKLKVITSKECALTFADTTFGSALAKSTTFCAGLQNGTNVCSGDSGGGIYFPASSFGSTRWYLLGLVSVGVQAQDGSRRCDPTRYSVFTKISPFSDWLDRILSEYASLYY